MTYRSILLCSEYIFISKYKKITNTIEEIMMKNMTKIFTILCLIISPPVFASSFLALTNPAKALLELTIIDAPVGKVGETKLYLGTSVNSPCSDLELIMSGPIDIQPEQAGTHTEYDDSALFSDLFSEFGYENLSVTCFRSDYFINGKTYSTGNIAFESDGEKYISATPNKVTVDFGQ